METLVAIIVLGSLCQLFAWKFRLPSILLLLVSGFAAGKAGFGIIDPTIVPEDLLYPTVSLAVAIILFEGGLSLRLRDVSDVQAVIMKLISIGALISWAVSALAAIYLLDYSPEFSLLLGAILTVSGPTAVIPLLQDLRVKPGVNEVLKWEAILVDVVGAIAAVLTLDALFGSGSEATGWAVVFNVVKTVVAGSAIAFVGAAAVIFPLKNRAIPDYLENPFVLMVVIAVHFLTNLVQPESGLLSVALLGFILANTNSVVVHHILEFKENLRVLLISWLFLILASRIAPADIYPASMGNTLLFLGVLIFIARPLGVFASTFGSSLNWRDRVFLTCVFPRGIVAAAVASLFGFELLHIAEESGNVELIREARLLLPTTFFVIVGTVTFYGIISRPAARLLGLTRTGEEGILFVGAGRLIRDFAATLKEEGFAVHLVDTNYGNVSTAKFNYLPATYGDIIAENTREQIDLAGIGKLFAMTPNNEANALACLRWAEYFGRKEVYQLPADVPEHVESDNRPLPHLQGRQLFGPTATYEALQEFYRSGAKFKVTPLTAQFGYQDFLDHYGSDCFPLCFLTKKGTLEVCNSGIETTPGPGDRLVSLAREPQADQA